MAIIQARENDGLDQDRAMEVRSSGRYVWKLGLPGFVYEFRTGEKERKDSDVTTSEFLA